MDLISKYIKAALEMEQVDKVKCTGKMTKLELNSIVRKHNRLADKLRNIAIKINTDFPELKKDFFQLLYHENDNVRGWVMFQILDAMDYDYEHRKKAMEAIVLRKEHDREINNIFEMWLNTHPEYRELL